MAISGSSHRNGEKSVWGQYIVCSGTSNFINDRRSGAKPWTCRKHCASLVYWLRQELNVNRAAGGIVTAVEMLSFKLRRVENGTVIDVDLRDFGFWKKN